jgi:thiol-disulfide isomerase/thioredoxin
MKRLLFPALLICIGLFVIILSGAIIMKTHNKKLFDDKLSKFPTFSFSTISGQVFNSDAISSGPVLVVHFHPECDHCQYELSEIFNNKASFNGVKVLLISSATLDVTENFAHQIGYTSSPDILILVDSTDKFGEIFNTNIIPANFIYSRKLELIKVLQGEHKLETILKYTSEEEY